MGHDVHAHMVRSPIRSYRGLLLRYRHSVATLIAVTHDQHTSHSWLCLGYSIPRLLYT